MSFPEFGGTLSREDFGRLADFIEGHAGIKMPETKRTLVEGRLRRRIKMLGMASFSDYCRYLFDEGGLAQEAVDVIDAVTTNKTEFFREAPHFRYLVEHALPKLVAGRSRPSLKVWSAACSSGAEPYSLAMTLGDFLTRQGDGDFTVYATDICVDMLHKGVRGIYQEEELRPVPADMQRRYLLQARDPERREVRIVPSLRKKVRFSYFNLMDEKFTIPRDLDVIFCRNVLIYFDHATQNEVLRKLFRHLRPGGYLFVGHTEALSGHGLPVRPVSNAVFVLEER